MTYLQKLRQVGWNHKSRIDNSVSDNIKAVVQLFLLFLSLNRPFLFFWGYRKANQTDPNSYCDSHVYVTEIFIIQQDNIWAQQLVFFRLLKLEHLLKHHHKRSQKGPYGVGKNFSSQLNDHSHCLLKIGAKQKKSARKDTRYQEPSHLTTPEFKKCAE